MPGRPKRRAALQRRIANAEAKKLASVVHRESHSLAEPVEVALSNLDLVQLAEQRNEEDEAYGYIHNPPSGEELYRFTVDVLGYTLLAPQPHAEMCAFLVSLFPNATFPRAEGRNFGMLLVPRDTFKSTVGCVAVILYLLVKNRSLTFLIDSYRHDVSIGRLRLVKHHITRNAKFRRMFGNWKPEHREDIWSDTAINIRGKNAADAANISIDPTIDTCGVDRPKVGSHPHVVIVDDAHNRDNVQTPTMRRNVYEHIGEFTPMLQPGGALLVLGTRWAHNDAYGHMLRDDRANIQAAQARGDLHPERAARYKTLIRGAKWMEAGQEVYYFPTRLNEKYLDEARRTPGMTEYLFRSQYFNETVESANALFPGIENEGWDWEFYHDNFSRNSIVQLKDGTRIPVLTTLAWDTAGHKPTMESDFHGLTVVGCDPDRVWNVLEGVALKATPNSVVESVALLLMLYRPHTMSIEVVGQSGIWITLLRNFIMANNLYMPYIIEARPPQNMNKLTRIDTTLQPLKVEGRLRISNKAIDLLNQMSEYPQVDHFDVIDSLAQHYNMVRPADPLDGLEYYDWEAMEYEAKVLSSDPRKRLGAFAGRSSTPRPGYLVSQAGKVLR